MELEHLRTFTVAARAGRFTTAADQLHVAQSTVSVHIRTLEQHVGAPLFDRLPAGIRLTEAGHRLMPLAERLLDLAAAAADIADQDSQASGEVSLAAPETVVAHRLPALLRHLRDHHPQLTVRLTPLPYPEIRSAVSTGLVDVGFLLQPPVHPTSTLAVKQLSTEQLLLVAAPDHPLATPVDDVADQFARTSLFLTEQGCGYRLLLEAHLDRAGVQPGNTLEFDSVEAIRRCIEAGLGVALIPHTWVTESLRSGALVTLDWFAPPFEVTTQVVWHPSRWVGPALTAVLDATESCIGSSPEHVRQTPARSA